MRTDHSTDLEITMANPVIRGNLSFEDYHEMLSSEPRTISVLYQEQQLFDITIPPTVFNPITSRSGQALADMILSGDIPVEGRRFVDLGCGSGFIGLAAAQRYAKSVLYTDINPNIDFLKSHPNVRPEIDRVVAQSFCENEEKNSADVVVFSLPSRIREQKPDDQSVEAAYLRDLDFIPNMVEKVADVLAPGGSFVFWYGVHPFQMHIFVQFIGLLTEFFDPASLDCLLEYQFEDGYTSNIYSIKKK